MVSIVIIYLAEFLHDTFQSVKLVASFSGLVPVTSGVPRESLHGLLFSTIR